ncbi:ABC transporter ATP-binding protein [Peribacillus sp. SCS-155]|uniref:ABC transporter ATP-binding protein n=1 Tax=Peribacillus sedimenti TaxID=3115297 RepID=UPI003905DBCE
MSLSIKNLTKAFGENVAVNNVSFSLHQGEVLGLLGRNGAGKTTTLKMLLELIPKDRGEITWKGKPYQRKNISIGYLPEERGLYPKSKINEQLTYFAKLEGMAASVISKEIDRWLERFEATEYKNKLASELSKGNQQKIQLIGTLLHNPEMIILDEPFSGLDPVNANLLSDVIREEMSKGKTIILSSHQMNQIETFCDNIVMIKKGNIIENGKLDDIKEAYGYKNLRIKLRDSEADISDIHSFTKEDNGEWLTKAKTEEEAIHTLNAVKQKTEIKTFTLLEPTLHEIFLERMG